MSLILRTIEPTCAVLELADVIFRVKIEQRDGRVHLHPEGGWGGLSQLTGRDPEWLNEEIDEAIYNAMPDLWSIEQV